MDYCTSKFPLYKVETIGDAYMVSGVVCYFICEQSCEKICRKASEYCSSTLSKASKLVPLSTAFIFTIISVLFTIIFSIFSPARGRSPHQGQGPRPADRRLCFARPDSSTGGQESNWWVNVVVAAVFCWCLFHLSCALLCSGLYYWHWETLTHNLIGYTDFYFCLVDQFLPFDSTLSVLAFLTDICPFLSQTARPFAFALACTQARWWREWWATWCPDTASSEIRWVKCWCWYICCEFTCWIEKPRQNTANCDIYFEARVLFCFKVLQLYTSNSTILFVLLLLIIHATTYRSTLRLVWRVTAWLARSTAARRPPRFYWRRACTCWASEDPLRLRVSDVLYFWVIDSVCGNLGNCFGKTS